MPRCRLLPEVSLKMYGVASWARARTETLARCVAVAAGGGQSAFEHGRVDVTLFSRL